MLVLRAGLSALIALLLISAIVVTVGSAISGSVFWTLVGIGTVALSGLYFAHETKGDHRNDDDGINER